MIIITLVYDFFFQMCGNRSIIMMKIKIIYKYINIYSIIIISEVQRDSHIIYVDFLSLYKSNIFNEILWVNIWYEVMLEAMSLKL